MRISYIICVHIVDQFLVFIFVLSHLNNSGKVSMLFTWVISIWRIRFNQFIQNCHKRHQGCRPWKPSMRYLFLLKAWLKCFRIHFLYFSCICTSYVAMLFITLCLLTQQKDFSTMNLMLGWKISVPRCFFVIEVSSSSTYMVLSIYNPIVICAKV